MPIVGFLIFALQIFVAWHALKSGRPYWWIFVIMAFPFVGCTLYYLLEVFPSSRERYKAGRLARNLVKSLDPDKDLRARAQDLEVCGSVDNRLALARECRERGLQDDAVRLYRSCLQGPHGDDPEIQFNLAECLAEQGNFEESLGRITTLREKSPRFREAETSMLLARGLEATGQVDAALTAFQGLAGSYPGEEGRWRYGALLLKQGRRREAVEVFEGMQRNADRLPRHYREAQRPWLAQAREALQELKQNP